MVLVVEVCLSDGQVVGLEAGDQITINPLGDSYGGNWCCLSKTSNSLYVRKFFTGVPEDATIKVGRSVSFKRSDVIAVKDVK